MRKTKQNVDRGTSSLELTLMLPMIVFFILFMIGMGHTLITRQHAVVAARYAATHQSVKGARPSAQAVSDAASAGMETWRLSSSLGNSAGTTLGGLGRIPGFLSPALGAFAGAAGSQGVINYTARTTPERGLLPRIFRLNDATSQYQIASGTWTCANGGGFQPQIVSQVRLPGVSLPQSLSCCETYRPR